MGPEPEGTRYYEIERNRMLKRCRGYVPVAPTAFAFSHVTAAVLFGMPVPHRLREEALHVSVPSGDQPPRRAGVVGHRGMAAVRQLDRLPVITPETAWLQLATVLTLDELIVAGDFLVRRKRPLSSLAALHAAVQLAPRMRGVALARTALSDVRAGTDSPPESWLRLVLVRAELPEPTIRFTVHHEGAFVGTPDLAYVEQRIAIEYEGEHHRLDPNTYEDDIYRREMFARAGWRVYLVTKDRLAKPHVVVAQVEELLRSR